MGFMCPQLWGLSPLPSGQRDQVIAGCEPPLLLETPQHMGEGEKKFSVLVLTAESPPAQH